MKKSIYYIIQWTWGSIATIVGALLFCLVNAADLIYWIFKRKHFVRNMCYRNAICTTIPWNFGGFSSGMFFIRGKENESVSPREYGHTIQNMWWGPLYLLVITLPSVIRYWYREIYYKWFYPRNRKKLNPYDTIWFEKQAIKLGQMAEKDTWSWL